MATLTIQTLLGGPGVIGGAIHSEMDLYQLGKNGIPKQALRDLAEQTGMTMKTLAGILQISERTLQRKAESDLLSEAISEHVIQIAQVFARGDEVFDSLEDFQIWLNTASVALGNKKPVELLSSRYGIGMILDELGRIEHGVFS